uniref:C2 domain-containing protein n=1 Tax=Leersia perrieri TaxID=77586 RepID=A0A0D9VMZ9_9ORYZ
MLPPSAGTPPPPPSLSTSAASTSSCSFLPSLIPLRRRHRCLCHAFGPPRRPPPISANNLPPPPDVSELAPPPTSSTFAPRVEVGEDPLVSKLRTQLGVIHPLPSPPLNRSVLGLFALFFFVGAAFDKLWTLRKRRRAEREVKVNGTWPQVPTSSFSLFLQEKDLQRKESVEWVNMVLGKLWKVYRPGIENWIVGLLQPVIDNLHKPDYVNRVEIRQFYLGEEPLSVRNVERRTSRRANDLQFLTKLLTEDLPRLFVRPKKIVLDFQQGRSMGPVAGDVASDVIQNFASGILQDVASDVIQDGNKDFVGELSVTLVDARKLSFVLFGKTDPYVVMILGDQVIKSKKNSQTSVIGQPGEPIWNQDFHMLVTNPRKQKLCIEVKDSVGLTDVTIGTGEVELGSLKDTVPTDKIVSLYGGWGLLGKRSKGEVLLRLTYKAYVEDEEDEGVKSEFAAGYVSDEDVLDYAQDGTSDMDGKERETFMDLLAALLVSEEFQGIVSSEPGSSRDSEEANDQQAAKSRDGKNVAAAVTDTGTVSNSSTDTALVWLAAITSVMTRGASSTMPLTVKQISDAQQSGNSGEKGAPFVVDGVETANVRLVGLVSGKTERNTDVSFTIDDGTGRLDFIRWVNDASDSAETAAVQNGMYVSVIGSVKGLQERKRATAFAIRPVTDYNEVTLHFIQCVRMHLENNKSNIASPAKTNSAMGSSSSNGLSEMTTQTSAKSNPAQLTSVTNGSEKDDLQTQVLNVLREPAYVESEHGVHIDEIAKRFRQPAAKIKEAVDYLSDIGHIYSTIDDSHYKSAFTE